MINLRPWFDSNVGLPNVNRFMFHAGSQVCQESRPMDATLNKGLSLMLRVLLMHKLDLVLVPNLISAKHHVLKDC